MDGRASKDGPGRGPGLACFTTGVTFVVDDCLLRLNILLNRGDLQAHAIGTAFPSAAHVNDSER